ADDVSLLTNHSFNRPSRAIRSWIARTYTVAMTPPLAYVEAEFLHIHPFKDFNGRAVRLLLAELMQRLDLPVVPLFVEKDTEPFDAYLSALRVYDADGSLIKLKEFWYSYRFSAA
ncbi:MAG: hypothetical protein J2P18_17375, partial [Nocardia sp.]|nr:hypothetical protein [Nocardia sp.]